MKDENVADWIEKKDKEIADLRKQLAQQEEEHHRLMREADGQIAGLRGALWRWLEAILPVDEIAVMYPDEIMETRKSLADTPGSAEESERAK